MAISTTDSFSDYDVTETIYQDDVTALYRARSQSTGNRVLVRALVREKAPLTDHVRLRHEFEISHALDAGCVTRALEVNTDAARPFVVLEDFDGSLLSDEVKRRNIDQRMFLNLGIQLANAVGELHREMIIHKNIKPANIFWNRKTGAVRLTDFSFASRLSFEEIQARPGGHLEGSALYMSPEQTGRTNRNVDNRTDLYALGVTFFEILTGRPPFLGDDLAEIVHAHIARAPMSVRESRPDVSPTISAIITKLLEKDADDRYQSAYGLKCDLEKCFAHLVLQDAGDIPSFPLGLRDITQGFRVSRNIFGRKLEVEQLERAFSHGGSEGRSTVVLRGPPGIGKTTIVQELRRPVEGRRGFFLSGKYDQLESTSPYAGILLAFRGLIRTMLAGSEDQLARWRNTIVDAVGQGGGVITEILPELELIIGPQPKAAVLAPNESRNRFNRTWQKFISAIAGADQPLVIFLDDLQWADTASLAFIGDILQDPQINNTLLVLAYRDEEVTLSHRLSLMLDKLAKADLLLEVIEPKALSVEEIQLWIQDSMRNRVRDIDEIAGILHEKTGGNPYYMIEFFRSMYRKELFRFDEEDNCWVFDTVRVAKLYATENVIDLILNRIESLSEDQRHLLMTAAGIGDPFNLDLLLEVSARPRNDVFADLFALVQSGLIQLSSDFQLSAAQMGFDSQMEADVTLAECRFPHDKARQAAYSLLPDDDRLHLHLGIGQIQLRDEIRFGKASSAVDHLNIARSLQSTHNERLRLARLNLQAGLRAMSASAPEVADHYFSIGSEIIEPDGWETDRTLTMDLSLGLAETQYLTGRTAQAEALCARLLSRCDDAAEKISVYERQIILYTSLSRYEEAIRTGIVAAPLVGLKLMSNPGNAQIGLEILTAKAKLFGKTNDQLLSMPMMSDEAAVAQMHFLTHLVAPAFLSNPNLAIFVALKMFNRSLRYGASKESPLGYMIYGVANAGTGDFDSAVRFGGLALQLNEQLETVEFRHVLHFLYGTAINHWRTHARDNLEYLERSHDIALAAGDFVYADYSLITILVDGYFMGEPLDVSWKRCQRYLDFFEIAKGIEPTKSSQGVSALIHRQSIAALTGTTADPATLSDSTLQESDLREAVCDDLTRFGLCCAKLQLLVLFESIDSEPPEIEEGWEALSRVRVMADVRLSEYCLYAGLVLVRLIENAPSGKIGRYRRLLRRNQKELAKWAKSNSDNYECRHLLLRAEVARSERRNGDAHSLYEAAIQSAQSSGFYQISGLASEFAARHFLNLGNSKIADLYLADARYDYLKWGAKAKVQWMDARYGKREDGDSTGSIPAPFSSGSIEGLDFNAVLKAGAALSNEIQLEGLVRKLLTILIENAGADGAVLVRKQDDRFFLEGSCWQGVSQEGLEFVFPVEKTEANAKLLPMSAFNYAVRTGEILLIGDATSNHDYRNDPFVLSNGPKSMLMVPLANQGKLTSVVFLQNSLASNAFTPDRIEFVKLLAGQAAISLENARLFRRQQQLTESAGNFVPHEFLRLLGKGGLEEVGLGDGVQRDLVIMFADIRGFTAISETMTPRESFEYINSFFQIIGPTIRTFHGFVGKYLGDGIMAFFPQSCDDAMGAAFETLRRLNNDLQVEKGRTPFDPHIGIGLHFGSVMMGIVGEERRIQCDVVSDAANVTARLEELTKVYGVSLIVSNNFFEGLKDPGQFRHRSLGRVEIRGREDPVEIIEIFEMDPESSAVLKEKTRPRFERGIAAIAENRFEEARQIFEAVLAENPEDRPAKTYLERVLKPSQIGGMGG